ncbi:hypothetical protein FVEN_g348 [Fusarium venenatum]|uniref:Uncharacterized protein n=1 Tax=Fusarium venenatum TaxID=56646 RepID=A0A2L2SYI7_9HYPO|nr:uncharacterized protein FVRRES_07540 [Fusarium venenatum]KAG8362119.1 hypothetical protein FVEN_g348 [Fusarium venenatum]KAH6994448.1 hypothetical protein EDB82DRAFT_501798 [Fusarium venenatum]CEI63104.1 unnamed protein product [Fusarium venenatum]
MNLFTRLRSNTKGKNAEQTPDQSTIDPHQWKLPSTYVTSGAGPTTIPDPKVFANVFSIPTEFESVGVETLLAYPDASHAAVHLALLECFRNLRASARALDVSVVQPPSYNEKSTAKSSAETAPLPESQRWDFLIKLAVTRFMAWWDNIDMVLNHASVYSHHAGSHVALQLTKDYLPPLDILLVWYSLMLNTSAYDAACEAHDGNAARLKNLCFPWPAVRDVIDMDKMEYELPRAAQNLFRNLSSQSCDILTYLDSPPAYTDPGKLLFKTDLFSEVKKHDSFINESHQRLWIRSPALHGSLGRAGGEYLDFHLREPNAVEEDMLESLSFGVQLFWKTHRLFPRQYKAFLVEIKKNKAEPNSKDDLKIILDGEDEPLESSQCCCCWICERIRDDVSEFYHTQSSTSPYSPSTAAPPDTVQKQLSSLSSEQLRQIQDDLGFYLAVEDARKRKVPLPTRPPTAAEKDADKIAKQRQKEIGYLPGLNEYVEVLPDGTRKIRQRKGKGNRYYYMMAL